MASTSEESRILDPCPNCTTLIDVTAMEPFSEIHCPICGTRMRVRKQFNNFALQKIIGEGGMGTVFEALDVNLLRPVAVKILKKEYSADATSIAQLETEARITASISHPHVVKVFSAGHDHGQFYLAMELVGRGTLDQLMTLQGQVAEIQVLDVGIQIADGLNAAAQIGLIHRDVKPGNILFSDAHTAKVVDFGLAILMEDEAKTRGEIWGTPYYVAPEKLNNEPEDFRSDIYSLGGTLFHALSGRPPFEAASASLVALKHLKSQAVSLQAFAPSVSNETAYVINRMLHKDPLERYQSYTDLIEHLKYAKSQLLERTAGGVKPKTRVVVESDAAKSFTAWVTMGLIALMIGMGIYVWVKRDTLFGGPETPSIVAKTNVTKPAIDSAAYDEALQSLANGKSDDAATLFDQFITSSKPAQPQLNWAIFQKGMAQNMSGQPSDARETYKNLQESGLYAKDGNEVRLAGFFVESARILKDKSTIPSTITLAYNNTDFEAIGLLAFALKNWALGDVADGGPLFEKFSLGKFDDDYTWLSVYKPLVKKYVADFQLYKTLATKVDAAKTAQEKTATLQTLRDFAGRLQTTGALAEQFQKWEILLTKDVGSAQIQAEKTAASQAEKALSEETTKWKEFSKTTTLPIRNFSPEYVIANLKNITFKEPSIVRQKNALQRKMEFLSEFKTKLVTELQTTKYEPSIASRNGAAIPGKIDRANVNFLFVKTDYGETAVAWKDISPNSIIRMSSKLLSDTNPGRKKWLIGIYATLCGNAEEGKEMLIEAAQIDESLRDDLATFFESPK